LHPRKKTGRELVPLVLSIYKVKKLVVLSSY